MGTQFGCKGYPVGCLRQPNRDWLEKIRVSNLTLCLDGHERQSPNSLKFLNNVLCFPFRHMGTTDTDVNDGLYNELCFDFFGMSMEGVMEGVLVSLLCLELSTESSLLYL